MDLTEAIKKWWQEYTEELYKKDLHDSDNHYSVFTHLEANILECEVKLALTSITTYQASEGDGIPVELFQVLKGDAVKCCIQYANKLGKLSNSYRTGKGHLIFKSQRRAMPKNVRTTIQFHLPAR